MNQQLSPPDLQDLSLESVLVLACWVVHGAALALFSTLVLLVFVLILAPILLAVFLEHCQFPGFIKL